MVIRIRPGDAPVKFTSEGSIRVGGASGQDSQPVAFRATPGEMIDVGKAKPVYDPRKDETIYPPEKFNLRPENWTYATRAMTAEPKAKAAKRRPAKTKATGDSPC